MYLMSQFHFQIHFFHLIVMFLALDEDNINGSLVCIFIVCLNE